MIGLLLASPPVLATIDLHMHLTMEVPLKGVFSGHLLGKTVSQDTTSRFKSRIDFDSLNESGLRVIIAAVVVNPLWGDPTHQIEEQIQLLREFCAKHPRWTVATEPDDVLRETAKGNKVFLLSLEGVWTLKDKASFERLLDRHPIRFVTPFHFTDLHANIGKSARQRGFAGWVQAFLQLFKRSPPEAISPLGRDLLNVMFDRGIWIDLSHAPNEFIEHFLKTRPKGYPILVTHTILAKYYATDRGLSENLVTRLKEEPGAVGLIPSMEMLVGTPLANKDCGQGAAFISQWDELVTAIGKHKVYLGSDLNAPLPTISPTPSTPNCPTPFLRNGLITARDLREIGALEDRNSINNFVQMWKLVRP